MAFPPNFRISLGALSGPIYLFLPIFANLFLITSVLIIRVSPEFANCFFGTL